MKIYNTYTEKKEKLDTKNITIYVCGITPDGPTHLGHAFLFVTYDTLVRYLKFMGLKVTYVQNVTDIDDDILIRSKAAGLSWKQMGEMQTKKHLQSMDLLNVMRPDFYPKATENIDEMIKLIKKLIENKFAYVKNNNVFFSAARDKKFGKLSKYGYRAMLEIANERGNFPLDPNKKDPLDFVLWQSQKPNEPFWDSPWGKGRPGWHIECSAMSLKYLSSPITIHGGGADLIFPHHEAEIAQSENSTGKKFVQIWMHTAMLFYEDKKMSKSLGNVVYIADLLKNYDANIIRILLLSHHYREAWNFEEKEFNKAKKTVGLLINNAKQSSLNYKELKKLIPDFFKHLDDDFNTPLAVEYLTKIASDQKNPEALYQAIKILGLKL